MCHQRHLLNIKNPFSLKEYFGIRTKNQCHLLFAFKKMTLKRFLRYSRDGAVYFLFYYIHISHFFLFFIHIFHLRHSENSTFKYFYPISILSLFPLFALQNLYISETTKIDNIGNDRNGKRVCVFLNRNLYDTVLTFNE